MSPSIASVLIAETLRAGTLPVSLLHLKIEASPEEDRRDAGAADFAALCRASPSAIQQAFLVANGDRELRLLRG